MNMVRSNDFMRFYDKYVMFPRHLHVHNSGSALFDSVTIAMHHRVVCMAILSIAMHDVCGNLVLVFLLFCLLSVILRIFPHSVFLLLCSSSGESL